MQLTVSTVLRTLFSRFLLFLILLVYALPVGLFLLLPKETLYKSKSFFWLAHSLYWVILKSSLLSISFKGLENLPQNKPVIFIANHQSSLDIPALGYLAKGQAHVWLALQYLMGSPILRFILPKLAILVDTTTPMSAMRCLIKAIKFINNGQGRHVMLFPEGGRYVDGEVHTFYGGFVILAKKTGRPVIPVFIKNLHKVYPPDSFWVYNFPVTITVGKATTMNDGESDADFKQRVYEWYVAQNKK